MTCRRHFALEEKQQGAVPIIAGNCRPECCQSETASHSQKTLRTPAVPAGSSSLHHNNASCVERNAGNFMHNQPPSDCVRPSKFNNRCSACTAAQLASKEGQAVERCIVVRGLRRRQHAKPLHRAPLAPESKSIGARKYAPSQVCSI